MTIERYISVMVILVAGLFLVNVSVPGAALANVRSSTAPASVQYVVPVNSWCVPATAGAVNCVQYTNNQGQVQTVCPVARPGYALGDAIGSILALPFDMVQCLLGSCP